MHRRSGKKSSKMSTSSKTYKKTTPAYMIPVEIHIWYRTKRCTHFILLYTHKYKYIQLMKCVIHVSCLDIFIFWFFVFVLCLFDIQRATAINIHTEDSKNIQFKSGKQNAQIHIKKTAQNTTHTRSNGNWKTLEIIWNHTIYPSENLDNRFVVNQKLKFLVFFWRQIEPSLLCGLKH